MNFSAPRSTLGPEAREKVEVIGGVAETKSAFPLFEEEPAFVAMMEGESHRFTFANNAYLKLVGCHKIIGFTVDEVLPELRDQGFLAIFDEIFRTGRRYVAVQVPVELYTGHGSDRHKRYLTFVYEPMRKEDGSIFGILIDGHDVTAKVIAEGNVQRLQSELVHFDRFYAVGENLAHELNQPLTAISNYLGASQLLLHMGGDVSALSAALSFALESTRKAANMIRLFRPCTDRAKVIERGARRQLLEFDGPSSLRVCNRGQRH